MPAAPSAAFRGAEHLSSDLLGTWATHAFFMPGDWLVFTLATRTPPLAAWLELSAADYGGSFSAIVSAGVWLAVATVLAVATSAIRDFDRALTARIVSLHTEARRRLRVARTVVLCRLRSKPGKSSTARSRTADTLEMTEEIDVSVDELRVLHALAETPPGYVRSAADLATTLGATRRDVQRIVSRLLKLNLASRSLGSCDDASGYVLTTAGRAFVMFRRLTAARTRPLPRPRPAT